MGSLRQSYEFVQTSSDHADAFRRQVKQEQQDRATRRDGELEEQISPFKDARERIEIWERIHALSLPRALTHALVGVIAKQTQLTADEVRAEQLRRSGRPAHV